MPGSRVLQEEDGSQKDTGFLGVGHSSSSSTQNVAVERDLQSVAVGCVVQEPAKKAPACPSFHGIPVERRAGLREQEHRDTRRVQEGSEGRSLLAEKAASPTLPSLIYTL